MTDQKKPPSYEIGYKRPPKSTQFKPGQSGNTKGRPKGSLNFMTEIDRELSAVVPISENGKKRKVQKKRIIAKQVVNKAAAGDLKATSMLFSQARIEEQKQLGPVAPLSEDFAEEDQQVIANILQRLRANLQPQTENASAVLEEQQPTPTPENNEGAPS